MRPSTQFVWVAVTSMRTLPVAVRSSMERRATAVSASG